MKTEFLVAILVAFIGSSIVFGLTFKFPTDSEKTTFELPKAEHYEIQITGMKDRYLEGEKYEFSYILSGYGDPCGAKSVSFPDQNGTMFTIGTSALCAADTPFRDFVFDIQKEHGTTYGHVKLKPGLYNLVITFEKLTDPIFYEFEVIPSKNIVDTFEEKYSDYEIIEYLDSKGFVWKYTVKTSNNDVELIFGDDRTILRSFDPSEGDAICTIVNPFPVDVLNYCPPKW